MYTQEKIKFRNVITSGLLAGILILIVGGCLLPILGNQMTEILKNRGLPPMETGSMIYFTLVSLVNGIGIIWIYALIENRFKSKFKAALIITSFFWFFTYVLSNFALVAYGFMPLSFILTGTVWGFGEILIVCLTGAKLYHKIKGA